MAQKSPFYDDDDELNPFFLGSFHLSVSILNHNCLGPSEFCSLGWGGQCLVVWYVWKPAALVSGPGPVTVCLPGSSQVQGEYVGILRSTSVPSTPTQLALESSGRKRNNQQRSTRPFFPSPLEMSQRAAASSLSF